MTNPNEKAKNNAHLLLSQLNVGEFAAWEGIIGLLTESDDMMVLCNIITSNWFSDFEQAKQDVLRARFLVELKAFLYDDFKKEYNTILAGSGSLNDFLNIINLSLKEFVNEKALTGEQYQEIVNEQTKIFNAALNW